MAHPPLHTGKWTQEESHYVSELIKEFEAGSLNIEEGISLRRFLSKALNCSPKRISKKFEGTYYNGKQVYKRKVSNLTPNEIEERRKKLREMERKYMDSLQVLEMVEASRKPVHAPLAASIQSNILPLRPLGFDSSVGSAPAPILGMGNDAAGVAALGSLPGLSREARVAQLKADITLASMAFGGGSNIVGSSAATGGLVAAARRRSSSLGVLGGNAQSGLLTAALATAPSSSLTVASASRSKSPDLLAAALANPSSLMASARANSPSSHLATFVADPLQVSHHLALNQLLTQGPSTTAGANPQILPPADISTLRAATALAGPSNHQSQLEGLKRGLEPPAESIGVAAAPASAFPAHKRLRLI